MIGSDGLDDWTDELPLTPRGAFVCGKRHDGQSRASKYGLPTI